MNHNGVISLPTNGASTYEAGHVVQINGSGQAVLGTANSTLNGLDAIGVVLQDVKADETDRPVDVQLFSAGGSALIKSTHTFTPGGVVEIAKNNSTGEVGVSVATPTTNYKSIGIAVEGHTGAGLSRVVLL